jgi:hypothetical protein
VPKKTPPVTAEPLIDLSAALDGYDDPGFGVDGHGAVYAVARRHEETLVLRWEPGHPPAQLDTIRLRGETARFYFVQPLPDGVLLAAPRCGPRRGGDKNALALDWRGRVLARFTLGDGIEDLRVTPDGTIWVSYFDEGVFGNGEWDGPGPAAGLVAFSAKGEVRFEYRPDAAGTDAIVDAYALNVTGDDDAWVYFYVEFPIVRIHNGLYHVWHTNVAGASALAVRGKRVLLYGDYDHRDVVRVLELGAKGSATVAAKRPLVDAGGAPFVPSLVRGIGASLYCFHDRAVSIVRDW